MTSIYTLIPNSSSTSFCTFDAILTSTYFHFLSIQSTVIIQRFIYRIFFQRNWEEALTYIHQVDFKDVIEDFVFSIIVYC